LLFWSDKSVSLIFPDKLEKDFSIRYSLFGLYGLKRVLEINGWQFLVLEIYTHVML